MMESVFLVYQKIKLKFEERNLQGRRAGHYHNQKVFFFEVLDVELNLLEEAHRPYTKPNNTILYIRAKSNHPPSM